MTILSFVTQDELDDLNEEPRVAFMGLVNHAQRSLSEQTGKPDLDDRYESNKKFDLEKTFMNVIVAAGKNFEVEPFSSLEIPRNQDFRDSDDQQFKSDLDHYTTQLVLSNSTRARGLSTELSTSSKDKVKA